MIVIVHGEDTATTRKRVINQSKKLTNVIKTEIKLEDTTPGGLASLLASNSMFGDTPFVILDITGTNSAEVAPFEQVIQKTPANAFLILTSYKYLPKTHLVYKKADTWGAKIIQNDLEQNGNIFKMVSVLLDKDRKKTYQELEALFNQNEEPFYIISMVEYALRSLAQAKFSSPAFLAKKGFQQNTLINQSRKFTEEQVKKLYKEIYNLEILAKTGGLEPKTALTFMIEKMLDS